MSLFIVVAIVWASAGTGYFGFRSVAPRKYNAYAAGRLDTLYVIFVASTFVLVLSGVWLLVAR